jgi:hypothetical protein
MGHLSASEIWPYFCFQDNLLIEFQHREDVDNILKTVGYFKNQDQMPFIFQEHGRSLIREEKVWLSVKKILTSKN